MKYKYVFLLGRPGCGKSAIYRELEAQLFERGQARTFERVDDSPKVWARIEQDESREKAGQQRLHTRRTKAGDIVLASYDVFGEILEEVNDDVLQIDTPDHIIFLEFARGNYVEAIQIFDERILRRAIVIYVDVDFDICWERNLARYEATIAQGGDDHLTPRHEMETWYRHDDRDTLVRYLQDEGIPVVVVNNEADGEERLKGQVAELLRLLFWRRGRPPPCRRSVPTPHKQQEYAVLRISCGAPLKIDRATSRRRFRALTPPSQRASFRCVLLCWSPARSALRTGGRSRACRRGWR